mgnify:CR=1 FL=1
MRWAIQYLPKPAPGPVCLLAGPLTGRPLQPSAWWYVWDARVFVAKACAKFDREGERNTDRPRLHGACGAGSTRGCDAEIPKTAAGRRINGCGRGTCRYADLARGIASSEAKNLLLVGYVTSDGGGQHNLHRGRVGQLYLPDGGRAFVARGAADHRPPHLPSLALHRRRPGFRHLHELDRGDHLDEEDHPAEGRLDEAGRRVEPHRCQSLAHGARILRSRDFALVR